MPLEIKLKKIIILVNMSSIKVGGGLQASITFLEYILQNKSKYSDVEFIFIITKEIQKQIVNLDFLKYYVVDKSPANLFKGFFIRKFIKKIESEINPNIVYSIGFPSYINFKNPEIGRYTNPFEICNSEIAFRQLNIIEKIKRKILTFYRIFYASNATFFETQTETAKSGIIKKFKVNEKKILVSPNTLNKRFIMQKDSYRKKNNIIKRIFCLSAAHKHKNLDLIPLVAKELRNKKNFKYKFFITLPNESLLLRKILKKSYKLGVQDQIVNLGPLNLDEVFNEYKKADCLFLPTLLEIFSASYIEAMSMGTPIVTTKMDFSKEICGDAALYFKPASYRDAASKLEKLFSNESIKTKLISMGFEQLKKFPTQNSKFESLIDYIIKCAYN